ncbi:hypothetical protein YB2330_000381 [Saitoella coloradoensis]
MPEIKHEPSEDSSEEDPYRGERYPALDEVKVELLTMRAEWGPPTYAYPDPTVPDRWLQPEAIMARNKAAFNRWIAWFNSGETSDEIPNRVLHPDHIYSDPNFGGAGIRHMVEFTNYFRSRFREAHITVKKFAAEGDTVISMCELSATQVGEHMGRPGEVREMNGRYSAADTFRDGLRVETMMIMDFEAMRTKEWIKVASREHVTTDVRIPVSRPDSRAGPSIAEFRRPASTSRESDCSVMSPSALEQVLLGQVASGASTPDLGELRVQSRPRTASPRRRTRGRAMSRESISLSDILCDTDDGPASKRHQPLAKGARSV